MALIQKGDWCGSAKSPSPPEREPKARVRKQRRFAPKEKEIVRGTSS